MDPVCRIFRIQIIGLMGIAMSALALSGCESSFSVLDGVGGLSEADPKVTIVSSFPTGSVNLGVTSPAQTFIVSATATSGLPLTYKWALSTGGAAVQTISSAKGLYVFDPSVRASGAYVLVVTATDGNATTSQSWSIKMDRAPVISATAPGNTSTSSPKGLTVGYNLSLFATATDPDADSLTGTWLLNGVSSTFLTGTLVGSSATATLTGDASLLGINNVTLSVNDGFLTTSYTWVVNVNYFNNACNNLSQGQICTYVGYPGMGSGGVPASALMNNIKGFDFDAAGNVYVLDQSPSTGGFIWVWNRGASNLTVGATTIVPGAANIIAGSGLGGANATAVPKQQLLQYPFGIAVVPTTATNGIGDIYYSNSFGSKLVRWSNGTSTNVVAGSVWGIKYYNNRIYYALNGAHQIAYWDLGTSSSTVVVGTGASGATGDGGLATAATATTPFNLSFDTNGNLYFVDSVVCSIRVVCATTASGVCSGTPVDGSNRIRFNAALGGSAAGVGKIYTVAGTGACGAITDGVDPVLSNLNSYPSIDVRSNGAILVADSNNRIRYINTSGAGATYANVAIAAYTIQTILGNGQNYLSTVGATGLTSGVGANGNNYSTYVSQTIRVDPTSGHLFFADSDGSLYSRTESFLRQLHSGTGIISNLMGNGSSFTSSVGSNSAANASGVFNPASVVALPNNQLIFAETNFGANIKLVNSTGVISTVNKGGGVFTPISGTSVGQYGDYSPYVFNDGSNNILFADSSTHVISLWNRGASTLNAFGQSILSGNVNFLAGIVLQAGNGAGATGLSSKLSSPKGAAANGGNLYIPDVGNHCIRKVDSSGNLSTVVGTCGTNGAVVVNGASDNQTPTATLLNSPISIVFDAAGNMYIGDSGNSVIRVWNPSASSITIFGKAIAANTVRVILGSGATYPTSSSSVANTTAIISNTTGMALDANENLYFVSGSQHSVMKAARTATSASDIGTAGNVLLVAGTQTAAGGVGGMQWDSSDEGIAATSAPLSNPYGITIDSNGDLYIGCLVGPGIRKVKLSP